MKQLQLVFGVLPVVWNFTKSCSQLIVEYLSHFLSGRIGQNGKREKVLEFLSAGNEIPLMEEIPNNHLRYTKPCK